MRRLILCALLAFTLAGCGTPLSLLTGGGPNVAANTQAGAENNQSFGLNQSIRPTIRDTTANNIEQSTGNTSVRSDKVDLVTVTNVDWKLIALLCFFAGVLFPSHREIARMVRVRFLRKSN